MVIVKTGRRICGTGGALANAPLVQDKAYFEMKVQSTGKFVSSYYQSASSQLYISFVVLILSSLLFVIKQALVILGSHINTWISLDNLFC